MRVANYPLAFAISVVMLATIFGMVLIGNAFFKLSGLFGEDAE
jgi:putative spermidine/putrescine transport system permease protein